MEKGWGRRKDNRKSRSTLMTYSATTTERTFRFIVLGAVVCAGFRSCSGVSELILCTFVVHAPIVSVPFCRKHMPRQARCNSNRRPWGSISTVAARRVAFFLYIEKHAIVVEAHPVFFGGPRARSSTSRPAQAIYQETNKAATR